jgi:uncharacterized zinc-type alcohol dehydrogenase-like protein
MISVKGYAAQESKGPLTPYSFNRRDVGTHDVLVDICYCGICHSDIHQVRGEWGASEFPMVPGHEIIGIVSQVGSGVTGFKKGDCVGVGCFVESCQTCENCQEHLEQYCSGKLTLTYNDRTRDGNEVTQGGYSTKIVVDERYLFRIPENLPRDAAAPLLCAGITLYSPLKHWKAGPGKRVAIVGLGGLGHMGIKFAHALGAEVTVLSHSMSKETDAKRLGANYFYSTAEPKTFEQLANYFDLIICTVSAKLDWNQYLTLLKRDATMVVIGVPEEEVPVNASSLIWGRKRLAGSLIGGTKETQEMLDFCGKNNIVSDIELIPIQQVNEAYERVLKSDVRYRFVIDMASL